MKTLVIVLLLALAGCVTTGKPVDKTKMAEGYFEKGVAHFQEKNYELASVEFNRSLQTDSSYKMSYYYLGVLNDIQGKPEEAIKYYKEAISLDSKFSEAYNGLGVVYVKQEKWQEALKCFNKALENKLYTTPHIPYLNMGDMYMTQKNYGKAVEAYREAKRYANLELTNYKLGTALFEAGQVKDAIKEFQEGVGTAPQNAYMRYSLAVALLKDGNKKSALVEFKKVAELAPGSEVAQKANDYIRTLR
ncbi:MAG TPA: tetratricopeptide repeat protein [Nitrospirota bacterium]|nr:tetratricopeptide repeat protein [Nitrospirota bacterium]